MTDVGGLELATAARGSGGGAPWTPHLEEQPPTLDTVERDLACALMLVPLHAAKVARHVLRTQQLAHRAAQPRRAQRKL
eukprot:366029-Chlamydomonas_euryale.AAC.20